MPPHECHHHHNPAAAPATASDSYCSCNRPRSRSLTSDATTRVVPAPRSDCSYRSSSSDSGAARHEQLSPRVRIAYSDDSLCANSRANMRRLVHAAQQQHTDSCSDNSVLLAKKALRYRNLLKQAQAADINDPAFEINDFLRVTWCKTETNHSA